MGILDFFVLAFAGFIGGALNAIAGGGSFIVLPAMVLTGLSPLHANASATAALLPGYVASAWRFRHDITLSKSLNFPLFVCIASIGGAVGALALLVSSQTFFSAFVPWLIIVSTLIFFIYPYVQKAPSKRPIESKIITSISLLVVCIYGGYFNGGLGVILLTTFAVLGLRNLQSMNGLKNLVSAILTVIAVGIYAMGETLHPITILIAGISALIGGYYGAALSYRLKDNSIRMIVILTGVCSAIYFFSTR